MHLGGVMLGLVTRLGELLVEEERGPRIMQLMQMAPGLRWETFRHPPGPRV